MNINEPTNRYVAWIDIMGSGALMRTSLVLARSSVGALHDAVRKAVNSPMRAFPMNDGVFLTTKSFQELRETIKEVFEAVATLNMTHFAEHEGSFSLKPADAPKVVMLRAAIAFGPTLESELSPENDTYGHVTLGPAVSNAYAHESMVGPFGIYLHESARMHGPQRYRSIYVRPGAQNETIKKDIPRMLTAYFDVAAKYPNELGYRKDRIEIHRALSREYFRNSDL